MTYDGNSIDKSGALVYIRDLSGQENDFDPASQSSGNTGHDAEASTDIPTPLGSGYSLDLTDSHRGFQRRSTYTSNKVTEEGTISTWFKYDDLKSTYKYLFYVRGYGANTVTLGAKNDGSFRFRTGSAGGNDITSSPGLIKEGIWHHVIAAYDGAKMKLWIDGNFIGEHIANIASIWGPGTMTLGGASFEGKLDESDFYSVVFEDF